MAVGFAATVLPFVLIAMVVVFFLWWGRRRSDTPPANGGEPWTRKRGAALLAMVIVLSAVSLVWAEGWSMNSVLVPAGWLVTGVALFWFDRLLDSRLHGTRPKMVGPVPFWWLFVWAAPLGWGYGMVDAEEAPWPAWLSVIVLAGLLAAALVAFCLGYGLRVVQ